MLRSARYGRCRGEAQRTPIGPGGSESFRRIATRHSTDRGSDGDFDDLSEWEVPVMPGHASLPAVLRDRHTFAWFDETPATGSGYLQRLSGIAGAPDTADTAL